MIFDPNVSSDLRKVRRSSQISTHLLLTVSFDSRKSFAKYRRVGHAKAATVRKVSLKLTVTLSKYFQYKEALLREQKTITVAYCHPKAKRCHYNYIPLY